MEDCRIFGNVSDTGIECNETGSNCSNDDVLADILQVNTQLSKLYLLFN